MKCISLAVVNLAAVIATMATRRHRVSQSPDLANEVGSIMPQVAGLTSGVENISHGQQLPGGPIPTGSILGMHKPDEAVVDAAAPPAKKARLILRVPSHSGTLNQTQMLLFPRCLGLQLSWRRSTAQYTNDMLPWR